MKYHNLSGIYYFHTDENNNRTPVCFEELSEEEQNKILDNNDPEYLKSLCKMLANTIKEIGIQFDLYC